jgi:hypothetical protein
MVRNVALVQHSDGSLSMLPPTATAPEPFASLRSHPDPWLWPSAGVCVDRRVWLFEARRHAGDRLGRGDRRHSRIPLRLRHPQPSGCRVHPPRAGASCHVAGGTVAVPRPRWLGPAAAAVRPHHPGCRKPAERGPRTQRLRDGHARSVARAVRPLPPCPHADRPVVRAPRSLQDAHAAGNVHLQHGGPSRVPWEGPGSRGRAWAGSPSRPSARLSPGRFVDAHVRRLRLRLLPATSARCRPGR